MKKIIILALVFLVFPIISNAQWWYAGGGTGGGGDMLESVYDPAGGAAQVAFATDLPEASTAAGQMLFGDASGGYDHSETSELFWNDTSKFLSIGAIPSTTGTIRLANAARIAWRNAANSSNGHMLFDGNFDFGFYVGGSRVCNFGSNSDSYFNTFGGNFGIGTTTPDTKLHVVDATGAQQTWSHTEGNIESTWTTGSDGVTTLVTSGNVFNIGGVDNAKAAFGAGSDMSAYYDGTSGYIKTDDVAASDLHITTGTAKTVVYDTPVYEDLNFDPENGGAAATRPASVTINNVFHSEFASTNNQLCGSSAELPHKYKLSTDLTPHIHIFLKSGESVGTTGVTFTYYWELRQSTGTTSGSLTLSATSAELGTTAGGNKFTISGTAFAGAAELDGQLAITIARTAGNAGDVVMTSYGVHYQVDTPGSRTSTTK